MYTETCEHFLMSLMGKAFKFTFNHQKDYICTDKYENKRAYSTQLLMIHWSTDMNVKTVWYKSWTYFGLEIWRNLKVILMAEYKLNGHQLKFGRVWGKHKLMYCTVCTTYMYVYVVLNKSSTSISSFILPYNFFQLPDQNWTILCCG